jgi:hypothetical protein
MKRLLFAWCVLLGLGWACPAIASPSVEEPEAREKPGVALWVEPLLVIPTTALNAFSYDTFFLLPLGLNVPLGPRQDLVVELTSFYRRVADCDGTCTSKVFSLAVGTSWRVGPGHSRGGFFIQPKLVAVLGIDETSGYYPGAGTDVDWVTTGEQLSVGLDVGYRVPSKHLVLEFVLGGSVGHRWNLQTRYSGFVAALLARQYRAQPGNWVWDINPNLIRIGGRF